MPSFNTLRYANGYYKPSAAALVDAPDPVQAAVVGLDSMNNTVDAYVVKYTPNGQSLWAARIGSQTGTDIGYSTTADSNGNIYVTGESASGAEITVFNADGTTFGRIIPNAGLSDTFIAKYNTNGVVQWVARIASTAADIGYGIAVDSSGNVYVTGQGGTAAVVTAYNSNGTAFATTILNAGLNDVFLVKYNSIGTVQWVTRIASSRVDIGYAICVDSGGNVHIAGGATTGSTASTAVVAYNANGTTGISKNVPTDGDAFIVKYNSAGTAQWLVTIGSPVSDIGYAIDVDSGGNVYVTGRGGVGVFTARNASGTVFATTLASAGAGDAFIVKYNSAGTVQWVARIASTAADIGYGIAVDSSGDLYVTGQGGTAAVVTAYNSNGTAFATTIGNSGQSDVFLVKYNSIGTVQWVTSLASAGVDIGYGIDTDGGNNVYLTGQIGAAGVFTIFNSNGTTFGTLSNTSPTNTDAFLVKYDSGGIVQWAQKLASSATDIGRGITVDPTGNMIVVGTYSGMRYSIYGQALSLFSSVAVAASMAFVVKYNTNGSPQWTSRITSGSGDIVYDTVLDSSGNLYAVGQGGGSGAVMTVYNSDGSTFTRTRIASSVFNAWVVKYNSEGFAQWRAEIGSAAADRARTAAVDSSGNLYVVGECLGTTAATVYNSDGTAFATTIPNAGAGDAFIVKYNSEGFAQWVTRIASTAADIIYGIAVDSGGNVYVTGGGGSSTVMVSILNSNGTTFTPPYASMGAAGLIDAFLVKYNSSGIAQWLAIIRSAGDDIGTTISIDSSDNVYLLTPSSTLQQIRDSDGAWRWGGGVSGSALIKYNSAGFSQWIVRWTGDALGSDITTDPAGNVLFTGYLSSVTPSGVSFYDRGGNLFTTVARINNVDTWVAKCDPNGLFLWTAVVGAPGGTATARSVATDAAGNVYIAGRFGTGVGGLVIINSAKETTTTAKLSSFAIIKFDSYGRFLWTQSLDSLQQTYSVCATSTGDVYIAGQTPVGTMRVFNSDFTPYRVLSSAGGQDAYVVKYSSTMTPRWAALISTGGTDTGFGIALDSNANVYVAVQCGGESPDSFVTTVYNGDGSVFGTVANAGDREAILVKYNSSGTGQWTARFATGFTDTGRGVATDSGGNVFFVGGCGNQQVAMFNSDGTTFASFAQSGNGDAIVTKYSGSGFGQWYARVASTVAEVAYSAATDISGNVYVTGIGPFAAGMDIFNANGTQFGSLTGIGENDVFLVKYNTNGAVQWAIKVASTAADIGYGTTVDSAGNIYIAGQTGSAATTTAYNADGSAFGTTLASLGLTDGFLIKYNTSGVVQWVTRMGGTGADIAYGVTTDSTSNVYVTGSFTGTGTFYNSDSSAFATTLANAGSTGAFLAKYNSAGFVQWVARIGGTGADVGYTIQVNSAGDVYVGGQHTESVNAYNSNGTFFGSSTPASSYGGAFSFIVKYNSSGAVQWISQSQGAGASAIQNMVLDSASNLYATGFITNGTFVPGST